MKVTYNGRYDRFRLDWPKGRGHVYLPRGVPVDVPEDAAALVAGRKDITVEPVPGRGKAAMTKEEKTNV